MNIQTTKIKFKKKPEHYVNNKEFLQAMILYKRSVNKAKRTKIIKPSVPDYIGECFLKIANHLSYRPNFINYTYRDDMISDGIENCLQYLGQFQPKKIKQSLCIFHTNYLLCFCTENTEREKTSYN